MVEIIKLTLDSLNKQNISATPRNYAREFYKLAKNNNHQFDDIDNLELVMNSLTQDELNEIKENNNLSASDLLDIISKRTKTSETNNFIDSLSEILKPSIDQTIYHKIEEVIFEIMKSPEKLFDDSMINKMLNITNERVELDRGKLKDKSNDIKKFITLLAKEYEKSLLVSTNSNEKLKEIKEDLSELEVSKSSDREVNLLFKKLSEIIYTLENNLDSSCLELVKGRSECSKLEKNIANLQKDLEKLKKENDIDFLTGLLNRRGYTSTILKVENRFVNFNSKYAIVFFDIDDFKNINDLYGHDCGDVVLKTFSTILNKTMRQEDSICRYGGEEFVALINYTYEDEVEKYVKRITHIVSTHKFIYNEEIKLKVQFSGGISYRDKYNSYEDAIKYADILLYKAKNDGKNKIIIDNGKVL